MKAVTALIGKLPSKLGTRAIKLHNKLMSIPVTITAGIKILWSLVLNMNLVRCGIASPKKAIGPQYAVTIAVKYPDMSIINMLFLLVFKPRFSAYNSPNSMTFNLLGKNKLAESPNSIAIVKNISLLFPTAENVPIPHITKA